MMQPSFITTAACLSCLLPFSALRIRLSVVQHSQTLGLVDVQIVYKRQPHLKASLILTLSVQSPKNNTRASIQENELCNQL